MARYRSFRDFDWPLLIITLIICALGVFRSIPPRTTTRALSTIAWWKQILYIFIALGRYVDGRLHRLPHLTGADPDSVRSFRRDVARDVSAGQTREGAGRWITLWRFNFQISEFVKLVIILVVARYLSELKGDEVSAATC